VVATAGGNHDRLLHDAVRDGQGGRVAYVETLTGFKWIARAAVRRPGSRLVFGYEEALGYEVGDAVSDKDGLSVRWSLRR